MPVRPNIPNLDLTTILAEQEEAVRSPVTRSPLFQRHLTRGSKVAQQLSGLPGLIASSQTCDGQVSASYLMTPASQAPSIATPASSPSFSSEPKLASASSVSGELELEDNDGLSLEEIQGRFIARLKLAYAIQDSAEVERLIDENPDLGVRFKGDTPLEYFIKIGSNEIAARLIDAIFLSENYTKDGRNSLVKLAIDRDNYMVFSMLLEGGCMLEQELLAYINQKQGLSKETKQAINEAKKIKSLANLIIIGKHRNLDYAVRLLMQPERELAQKQDLFNMLWRQREKVLLILNTPDYIEGFASDLKNSELKPDCVESIVQRFYDELTVLQRDSAGIGRYDFGYDVTWGPCAALDSPRR